MSTPLAGLKVLELGQLIAGPFAARTLADFGADVVKIESPGSGDPLRKWRLLKNGTSVWWQVQSRNKRSVALDLKDPAAQDIVRQLAAEADVLVENFRPGAMEAWGLGPDVLLALNPRLARDWWATNFVCACMPESGCSLETGHTFRSWEP